MTACGQLVCSETAHQGYVPFVGFPKMPRLLREVVVTEKIDGTNAQIYITEELQMHIGSRKRWINIHSDNYGFAQWATRHKDQLLKLGPGSHFGEWWGCGIQRRYNQECKKFSLFNTTRWADGLTKDLREGQEHAPPCCHVVPELYRGPFDQEIIESILVDLRVCGSEAAPGFMRPEGVIVYHTQAGTGFKITLDGDGHKGAKR